MSKRPIRTHTYVGETEESADGVDFPFVVESDTDIKNHPVAGRTGTKVSIVEEECTACGYDRARVIHALLPDVYAVRCMACDAVLEEG